ncbi:MAG: DUF1573 domain-containing protein [Cytophagales bacterium]|nr:DUF1573 domain-containing protein [Bernardetiaceae bacterium]MDW8210019.1 DUF1573 domain-containing protein [Cytophagales bacterium]
MKRYLLLVLGLVMCSFVATAQQTTSSQSGGNTSGNLAAFQWDKTVHDFGNIPQNQPVTATFRFKNAGKIPLIITSAMGSCGCTVPSWPREPIAPGESAEIKATFNAAAVGAFNKTVTLTANVEGGTAVLTLKGTVEPAPTNNN